jgi:hypothetical protein
MQYQRLCVPSEHNYCTGNVLHGPGNSNEQLTFIIDQSYIRINHINEETPKRVDSLEHSICMWKRWWLGGYKRRVLSLECWEIEVTTLLTGRLQSGLDARLEQRVLSALAELRKASSYLSVRMVQLSSHWTDFHEIWHFRIFLKSVGKCNFD